MCDALESRRLMAIDLPITTTNPDVFIRTTGTQIQVWNYIPTDVDNPDTNDASIYTQSNYNSITVTAASGPNRLLIDTRTGSFSGIRFYFPADSGLDTFEVIGTTANEGYFYASDTSDTETYPNNTYSDPYFGGAGVAAYTDAEFIAVNVGGASAGGDTLEVYGTAGTPIVLLTGDVGPNTTLIIEGVPVRLTASQHNADLLSACNTLTAVGGRNILVRSTLPSSWTSRSFDLNDNTLVLDYSGASPVADLLTQILAGRNSGNWHGTTGIKSSNAYSTPAYLDTTRLKGIGYAEASELLNLTTGTTSWTWKTGTAEPDIDTTTLLVRGTWLGDANLDGTVDAADFEIVRKSIAEYAVKDTADRAAHVNWYHGDFNYDGQINAQDIKLMTASYNSIRNADFDLLSTVDFYATGNPDADPDDLASLVATLQETGGTVVIHGTVNLGSVGLTLDSYSDIRFRAASPGDGFVIESVPAVIGTPFQYGPGMLMFHGCTNMFVEGLTFDGGDQFVNGVSSVYCTATTVDACDFTNIQTNGDNPATSCYSRGSTGNHYTNNTVHDGPSGIALSGQWGSGGSDTGTIIVGNTVRRHSYDVFNGYMINALIAGNDVDGAVYSGNTVTAKVGGGMALSATAQRDQYGVLVVQNSQGCVVFDNIVKNSWGGGFQCDAWVEGTVQSVTVFRNSFIQCTVVGLLIQSATDSNFIDNDFTYNGKGTDLLGCHNVLIEGNDFSYSVGDGIFIESNDLWADPDRDPPLYMPCELETDGLIIRANTASQCGGYGIDIGAHEYYGETCTISNITIESNTITHNGIGGIRIEIRESRHAGALIGNIDIHDNTITTLSGGYWLSIHVKNAATEIIHVHADPDDQTYLSNDTVDDNRDLF